MGAQNFNVAHNTTGFPARNLDSQLNF